MCHLHKRTLISQIFYISPQFWAIFDDFNPSKMYETVKLYSAWCHFNISMKLGNNQHADVIWGEIIFELMQFGIIAYIFLRLRVWLPLYSVQTKFVPIHQEIWILTCTYMYFQYFQISFLCPRIKWPGAYCFCPGAYCFCPVCLLSTLTFAIIF